jgi:hypothetical protein
MWTPYNNSTYFTHREKTTDGEKTSQNDKKIHIGETNMSQHENSVVDSSSSSILIKEFTPQQEADHSQFLKKAVNSKLVAEDKSQTSIMVSQLGGRNTSFQGKELLKSYSQESLSFYENLAQKYYNFAKQGDQENKQKKQSDKENIELTSNNSNILVQSKMLKSSLKSSKGEKRAGKPPKRD